MKGELSIAGRVVARGTYDVDGFENPTVLTLSGVAWLVDRLALPDGPSSFVLATGTDRIVVVGKISRVSTGARETLRNVEITATAEGLGKVVVDVRTET